jgi:dTDP-4-dehydrorhamnose 3,5-epimerase
MRFREAEVPGVYVIELEPKVDDRGFFARAFAKEEFAAHGLPSEFPHHSMSRNTRAATLRGLHYNAAPLREAKLVRCTRGAVWDVVVDLRLGSPTWLRWSAVALTAERGEALLIPEGLAHGFITLADSCDVYYQLSRTYAPEAARGLRWNDPRLGIRWPQAPVVISERDRNFPDFDETTFDG